MLTLTQRIEAGATAATTSPSSWAATRVAVSYRQLHEEARAYAANLQALGVGPGDHVALLGPTSRPLVTAIQAIWLSGATVVVLPLPMRLSSIEEFVHQTRVPHHQRRRLARARRPRAGAVHRARARRPADARLGRRAARPRSRRRRGVGAPRRRPRSAGDPAVHQRVHLGPEGRDAPAPHGGGQPRRHRPRHVARSRRRRPRVVAAAVPRHGAGRVCSPSR